MDSGQWLRRKTLPKGRHTHLIWPAFCLPFHTFPGAKWHWPCYYPQSLLLSLSAFVPGECRFLLCRVIARTGLCVIKLQLGGVDKSTSRPGQENLEGMGQEDVYYIDFHPTLRQERPKKKEELKQECHRRHTRQVQGWIECLLSVWTLLKCWL